jgi:hypothetical protein
MYTTICITETKNKLYAFEQHDDGRVGERISTRLQSGYAVMSSQSLSDSKQHEKWTENVRIDMDKAWYTFDSYGAFIK